LRLR